MAIKNSHGLTTNQEVFSCALASGMSQADAYRKAYPKCLNWTDKAVWEKASLLASNVKVQQRVKDLQEKACEENEITVEKVLKRYWDIATANPNDIMQYRRECCRHCYGINHEYQWKDEKEFFKAEEQQQQEIDEAEENSKRKRGNHKPHNIKPLSNEGGYGFDPLLSPHAKCPQCNGEGNERAFFHDTRHLKGGAQLLYAGVEVSKDGLKIKTHDQKAALDKVASWLGMDKKTLSGDKENPLVPAQTTVTRIVIVPAKEKAIIETKVIPPATEMEGLDD